MHESDFSPIRAAREEMGLSQVRFAEAMHVSKSTISRWENPNDPYKPSGENLERLCRKVHKPASFLLGKEKTSEEEFLEQELERLGKEISELQEEIGIAHQQWAQHLDEIGEKQKELKDMLRHIHK